MKIAFFTEGKFEGKVPRTHPNMRTDLAWQCALGSDHIPLAKVPQFSYLDQELKYDLGIVILPKNNHDFVNIVSNVRRVCRSVAIMQEGPRHYFQDYPIAKQIYYYNVLAESDFILCHNNSDLKYYTGILNHNRVHVMPTLMIEDSFGSVLEDIDLKSGVVVGGNMVSWYGGFDSMIVAQSMGLDEIVIPSMGRKQPQEEQMWSEANYLPYMQWAEWIKTLSWFKYAIHLMPTQAAGTFALNCARVKIPCIGYKGLDTQEICHPSLTVELGDVKEANYLAKRLVNDQSFYKKCVREAEQGYENFTEEVFIGKMGEVFKKELE
jgi:hypothetical protein